MEKQIRRWTICPSRDLCIAVPASDTETPRCIKEIIQTNTSAQIAVNLLIAVYCAQCALNPNNTGHSKEVTRLFLTTVAICSGMNPETCTATLEITGPYEQSIEDLRESTRVPACQAFRDKKS